MSFEYPINVYKDQLQNSENYDTFANLIYNYQWSQTIEFLEQHPDFVNNTRLLSKPTEEGPDDEKPKLFTCLHQAAHGRASANVIKKLLDFGALRSLKNHKGQTAYDIAKANILTDDNALKLLQVPNIITDNKERIDKMEKALHEKVIMGEERNTKGLIEKNGQVMPQISVLWELETEDSMWYPVPGMYGGFNISIDKKEWIMQVDSWCRVCGGSEMRHIIDREGVVTDKSEEVRSY